MKRCKHQTGVFFESIEACHERQVIDGILDPDSFNNEYGNGLHHSYECALCKKRWLWKSEPKQKWLQKLFISAYIETSNERSKRATPYRGY